MGTKLVSLRFIAWTLLGAHTLQQLTELQQKRLIQALISSQGNNPSINACTCQLHYHFATASSLLVCTHMLLSPGVSLDARSVTHVRAARSATITYHLTSHEDPFGKADCYTVLAKKLGIDARPVSRCHVTIVKLLTHVLMS